MKALHRTVGVWTLVIYRLIALIPLQWERTRIGSKMHSTLTCVDGINMFTKYVLLSLCHKRTRKSSTGGEHSVTVIDLDKLKYLGGWYYTGIYDANYM